MKKAILFLLVLALLLPSSLLTSCGGGGSGTNETTGTKETTTQAEVETTTKDVIGFDKQNYQKEFNILLNSTSSNARDFTADEMDGDSVSKATHNRNLACEEYLGVLVEYTLEPGQWNSGMVDKIRDLVYAGTCNYDMVVMGLNTGIIGGYIDIYQNIMQMDYIDLEHSWWVQDLIDQVSINNQLYFLCGDACITT